MISEYLYLLIAIFGISAVAIYFLGKLRIPSIVGFLVGGMIIGSSGLNLVRNIHEIEFFAEIGVILLMFTIGLEFSLKNLFKMRSLVFGGGTLQVLLSTLVAAMLSHYLLPDSLNRAFFNGIIISLSSTAIVFKMIIDRAETHTPYGRTTIGILIFQDLCVVLYILLIPVLAGRASSATDIALTVFKAVLVVGGVLFSAKWVIPWLLHEIVKTRSRELFIIAIIALCLGTALLTSLMGLSLALGAFLAGVIFSESEYSAQTVSDVLPLKESFSAFFFISIGMLLDLSFLFNHFGLVLLVVVVIIVIKFITAAVSSYLIGQSPANSVRTGLYLSQIGEFSFVVAITGKKIGLMTDTTYQFFLSAAVLTMIVTPFLFSSSARISSLFLSFPLFRRLEVIRRKKERDHYPHRLKEHVIIIGFGVNGGNLAKNLRYSHIPYVILELNSETVRSAKKEGEPIYYGDGTRSTILRKLGIQSANTLVVAISDASATRTIVKIARSENPYLYIIARTRYVSEVDELIKGGANEVIPEEFETSVEIFSKVLYHYHVPVNVIRENIDATRADNYRALRTVHFERKPGDEAYSFMRDVDMETFLVTEDCCVCGCTLADIQLRTKTGATVIGIKRGDDIYEMPSPTLSIHADDILVIVGKKGNILSAVGCLKTGETEKMK